jgi:hypothetical protein
VRLELISVQFIAQFIHKYIHQKGNCDKAKQQVLEAYQYHCLPDTERPNPRKFLRNKAIYSTLYIFGGDDGVNDASPYRLGVELGLRLELGLG